MKDNFRSGFVSLIGRANVGKSSFLNKVVGHKIAITSNKPQTTRNKISGIRTTSTEQIIFVDTPGVHKPNHELDNRMQNISFKSQYGVDLVLFMTTPLKEVLKGDEIILDGIRNVGVPVYLVINKIDQLKKPSLVDETILLYQKLFPFKGVYPISVKDDININHLLTDIVQELPEGPLLYDEDTLSDKSERFIISEYIREKVLLLTKEEIPHSIAVSIDLMKQGNGPKEYSDIYATIICERESQKKIIIGKNGSLIKEIKEKAINDIKRFLNTKVHLDLWVKVKKDWRNTPRELNSLGYTKDDF